MSAHRTILFWLAARNDAALKSIQNEVNRDSVGLLPGLNASNAFVVALDRDVRTPGCLLTLGREGDVQIFGSQISRIQCQIQLNPTTQEILIRDTSAFKNTKVVDCMNPDSLFFSTSDDVPRQVVIRVGDNIHLSMGGDNKDLFQYEVKWPIRDTEMQQEMEAFKTEFLARRKHRQNEVTHYTTRLPALRYEARIQPSGSREPWLHRTLDFLGAGSYGDVFKTVNMHTGEYFAVKVMWRTEPFSMDIEWRRSILEEVRFLETLSYVSGIVNFPCIALFWGLFTDQPQRHVAEYYHSQGFQTGQHPVEIFMGLYNGSVENLIEANPARRQRKGFLISVFKQMLRALMYIASVGIIHRDVKPENILYTVDNSASSESTENPVMTENFRFVLADFGLSKEQVQARTSKIGSPLFMAPEMRNSGVQQTHKVDVYSLGVTILVIADAGKIYSEPVKNDEDLQSRLQHALQDVRCGFVAPLLCSDPLERPSAQDLFLEHWPDDEEAQRMTPKSLPIPKNNDRKRPFVARDQEGKHVMGRPLAIEGRSAKPTQPGPILEKVNFRHQQGKDVRGRPLNTEGRITKPTTRAHSGEGEFRRTV